MPVCVKTVSGVKAGAATVMAEGQPIGSVVVIDNGIDPSGQCGNYALVTMPEFQALQGNGTSLPSAADAAAAWGLGFTFVVGSYVIGWAVGSVVNFINRD